MRDSVRLRQPKAGSILRIETSVSSCLHKTNAKIITVMSNSDNDASKAAPRLSVLFVCLGNICTYEIAQTVSASLKLAHG